MCLLHPMSGLDTLHFWHVCSRRGKQPFPNMTFVNMSASPTFPNKKAALQPFLHRWRGSLGRFVPGWGRLRGLRCREIMWCDWRGGRGSAGVEEFGASRAHASTHAKTHTRAHASGWAQCLLPGASPKGSEDGDASRPLIEEQT